MPFETRVKLRLPEGEIIKEVTINREEISMTGEEVVVKQGFLRKNVQITGSF
jgi:hypothetical protein